jgi:hypothetical protein
MTIELILYAVVAVVLLARLWSIFGRRSDDEPQRPNPFVTPAPGPREDKTAPNYLEKEDAEDGQPLRLTPLRAAPASLA